MILFLDRPNHHWPMRRLRNHQKTPRLSEKKTADVPNESLGVREKLHPPLSSGAIQTDKREHVPPEGQLPLALQNPTTWSAVKGPAMFAPDILLIQSSVCLQIFSPVQLVGSTLQSSTPQYGPA
jgi:hypothetical protein